MIDFKIGDIVIMYKTPSEKEWEGIGEVLIPSYVASKNTCEVIEIGTGLSGLNKWIRLKEFADKVLPACCFKYVEHDHNKLLKEAARRFPSGCSYINTEESYTFYDTEYSADCPKFYVDLKYKKGEAIMIAEGKGFVYSKGKWATRIEDKKRKHKFLVGDIIVGNKLASEKYGITHEGCICEILKTYYDAEDDEKFIKVKLISNKDSTNDICDVFTVLEECFDLITEESPFHSQIKSTKNGKEHNNTDGVSVKVPRLDFKISRGNPIRGIGLNSSRSKVKLRSDSSYD